MPGVVRLGDVCTGHECFNSRPNVGASGNVSVNGLGAHRVGDPWAVHCCVSCHDSVQATGSGSVSVNGMPVARVGDSIACGSINATGSGNVSAG